MRILVVEDEPNLNKLIVKKLEMEHYSVDACLNGSDALDYLKMTEYDAVVLDIMLPAFSGFDILKLMRENSDNTPVIFLTAMDGVDDRVKGLEAGADDYLVKPFAFDELTARVKAIIRRSSNSANDIYELADLKVDCTARTVTRGETDISLSAKEFAILEYMIRNKEKVLSRDKISRHIWNYDYEGGSNMVDVYIRYLRRKIDEPFENKLIQTVRGAGYVLREEK